MNDSRNIVTGAFVVVAIALTTAAYVVYPKALNSGIEEQVNKPLFEFEPDSVRQLSIVKFEQSSNTFEEIVMENNLATGWTIPSKFRYPVDSGEKLILTASSLSGLIVLDIASEDPNDEETYGVIEPKPGVKAGQEGVGIKVTLKNREKQDLASVIIGKEVKDQPGHRFVRVPDQRFIYVCEYDPSILKTDFFSWINPKILQLGAQWAVNKLTINKYSATKNPLLDEKKSYRADLVIADNQWTTQMFADAADPDAKPRLDLAELERVRIALENFEIRDVTRKNAAASMAIQQRQPIPNTFQVAAEMQKLGFFFDEKVKPAALVGAGGELAFTANLGIRYEMMFGGLVAAQVSGKENDLRYVMITAKVDETMYPLPPDPTQKKATNGGNDAPKPPPGDCGPGDVSSGDGGLGDGHWEPQQDDDDREARRQYQIKLNERKQRIAAAQKAADQINQRFANWFYLIDNALYRRLMPKKEDLISRNQ